MDISLYKAKRYDKEHGDHDYFVMSENKDKTMYEQFKDLFVDVEEEHFDFNKAGITNETHSCRMAGMGKFNFGLRKHPLYPLYEKLNGIDFGNKSIEEAEKLSEEIETEFGEELRKAGWEDGKSYHCLANNGKQTFYDLFDFVHDSTEVVCTAWMNFPSRQ